MTRSISGRNAKREPNIIRGSDSSMTAQAYTEMMSPVTPSLVPNEAPMPVKRPTGMNSEVLNMNAETVMPIRGNHSRNVSLLSTNLVMKQSASFPFPFARIWDCSPMTSHQACGRTPSDNPHEPPTTCTPGQRESETRHIMGQAARAGQTPVRRRSPPIVSASLIYRFEGIPKPIMQPVNTTPHPLGGSRNDLR